MKFFINQHSDLPYLSISLIDIGEKYNITSNDFENAVATFSMYNVKNNQFIIANEEAEIYAQKRIIIIDEENNYYVRYKFTTDQTQNIGEFIGEFKINFLNNNCGTLTVPIDEKLNIIIKRSITKTKIENL
jgi:hypothetical protein